MTKPAKFNSKSKCPKCQHGDVRSIYEPPIDQDPCWYDRKYNPPDFWPVSEFIKRICRRCGYAWPEACRGAR